MDPLDVRFTHLKAGDVSIGWAHSYKCITRGAILQIDLFLNNQISSRALIFPYFPTKGRWLFLLKTFKKRAFSTLKKIYRSNLGMKVAVVLAVSFQIEIGHFGNWELVVGAFGTIFPSAVVVGRNSKIRLFRGSRISNLWSILTKLPIGATADENVWKF